MTTKHSQVIMRIQRKR